MNIRMLQMFIEVVRQGSFSAAARKLHASQPAVSKAVQALEDGCGMRLLDRQYLGVQLTDHGSFIHARALRIMAEVEALESEIAAVHGLEKGTLHLGIPSVGGLHVFAAHLAAFRELYPGIHVDICEDSCAALERQVLSGELEIGFTLLPASGEFECVEVVDEPVLALMPPRFPLEGRTAVKLEELAAEPLLLGGADALLGRRIECLARQRRLECREGTRGGRVGSIIMMVAAGLGVGLLPRPEVQGGLPATVQTALLDEEELRWRGAFIWRSGASLSPAARAWISLARNSVADRENG